MLCGKSVITWTRFLVFFHSSENPWQVTCFTSTECVEWMTLNTYILAAENKKILTMQLKKCLDVWFFYAVEVWKKQRTLKVNLLYRTLNNTFIRFLAFQRNLDAVWLTGPYMNSSKEILIENLTRSLDSFGIKALRVVCALETLAWVQQTPQCMHAAWQQQNYMHVTAKLNTLWL